MNAPTMNATRESGTAFLTIPSKSHLLLRWNKSKNIYVLLLLFIAFKSNAQNFNYSVVTQTEGFEFLNDSIKSINDNNIMWDDNSYKTAIGFSFVFAGQSFDSLKIQTNGTITFDNISKYNFVGLFKNFVGEVDSMSHSISPITKELTTLANGSKRLKIEFQNAAFVSNTNIKVHVNFQIWINQLNNSIEFHMGPTDASLANEISIIGLLNSYGDGALGYLLEGSTSTPNGVLIPVGGNAVQLTTLPINGTAYIFTQQ
jgi:hypothetical protein